MSIMNWHSREPNADGGKPRMSREDIEQLLGISRTVGGVDISPELLCLAVREGVALNDGETERYETFRKENPEAAAKVLETGEYRAGKCPFHRFMDMFKRG